MPFTIETTTTMPIVIPDATAATDGLMTAADKAKIDGLPSGRVTFNTVYQEGTSTADSRIQLDSTRAGLWLKDATPTIAVILFAITDSTESYFYLSVRTTRTLIRNAASDSAGALAALTVNPGTHTNNTASAEIVDVDFAMNRTVQWATGAIATQRSAIFRAPTLAFTGASTVTNAATVAITGGPIQGTNATITNSLALWVQSGGTQLSSVGFYGASPVVQQTAGGITAGFTAGAGGAVLAGSTFTGNIGGTAYTIGDLIAAMKTYNLLTN